VTGGIINDRTDKYMNENEANEWERRSNERNFGFRMQTAVRGEAVTGPLIACLYRTFKSSSFFDGVWSSLYGLQGALSGVHRAFCILPIAKILGPSNFLVTMFNSFHVTHEISRLETMALHHLSIVKCGVGFQYCKFNVTMEIR